MTPTWALHSRGRPLSSVPTTYEAHDTSILTNCAGRVNTACLKCFKKLCVTWAAQVARRKPDYDSGTVLAGLLSETMLCLGAAQFSVRSDFQASVASSSPSHPIRTRVRPAHAGFVETAPASFPLCSRFFPPAHVLPGRWSERGSRPLDSRLTRVSDPITFKAAPTALPGRIDRP